ncbi:MAG: T9SS type A sorting domain-containing protein [Candidatus Kapabacteria bacterium]|nr:T9SS type A sorting domain-containing protein [Candidatus Kapabacteria bacterium]
MRFIYRIILFLCFALVLPLKAVEKEASIVIDKNNSYSKKATSKLFGGFIEYLRDYVNGSGGLWAQELLDRGFDAYPCENINIGCVWKDTASSVNAIPELIQGGYNPNGKYFKRLTSINDDGFCSTYQTITYCDTISHTIYLYYRGMVESGSAKIIVMDKSNTFRLSEILIPSPTEEWTKFETTLQIIPGYSSVNVFFALEGKGSIDIDEVSCVPDNNVGGLRKEWFDLLKEYRVGMLRYPGGWFADLPQADFENGIGPIDKRVSPNLKDLGEFQRMDFGTDEFLKVCELIGAEPHIVLNYKNGTPERGLEWVKYCNADLNDEWGNRRKENGRSEPYNVKYFEIGNEQWDNPVLYTSIYVDFYNLLKNYDPSLKIIIDGNEWLGSVYFDTLATVSSGKIDIYGYHPALAYDTQYKHSVDDIYNFLVNASYYDIAINNVKKSIEKHDLQNKTLHAVSEWWTHWADGAGWLKDTSVMQCSYIMSLANAGLGISFLRNGYQIDFAERTLGINFIRRTHHTETGKRAIFGQSSYIGLKILSQHFGENIISADITTERLTYYSDRPGLGSYENVPMLDAVVTSSSDTLFISVLNRYLNYSVRTSFNINHDFSVAKIYQIYNENITDIVTAENPDIIQINERTEPFVDEFIFPPHSITVLALPYYPKTSVNDEIQQNLIYPNPAKDKIIISFDNPNSALASIKIINTMGVEIESIKTRDSSAMLSTKTLASGMYFVHIIINGELTVGKFVIAK